MVDNIFEYFPKILYKQPTLNYSAEVINIMHRFVLKTIILDAGTIYWNYDLVDGERPDNVANKFYDNPKMDWLVLMVNYIFDPHFQWYMGYTDFINFIKCKYGSLEVAHQTVHHYEEYVSLESYQADGRRIPTRTVIVDLKTYNSLADEIRDVVSCYRYEKLKNEDRRTIKVLHRNYVPQIMDEMHTIFK